MENKQKQGVRKFRIIAVLLVLMVLLLGCEFPGANAPAGDEAALPSPTITDTDLPTNTPSNTPTITKTPTKTIIPSATIKPTLRPSWTPFTPTLRPTWTASPTLSPTPTPEVGIFLEEDFSDINTPWLQRRGENWNTFIVHEAYYLSVHVPNVEITSARPWIKFAEVRIEADIRHNNGNGYYGFSCRETVAQNYYTIFVTTDGYYGFGQLRDLKVEFFEVHPMPKLKIPFDGKGINHIRAECRGDQLTLAVNGEIIDQYTVPGLGPGYVGMMAGTRLEDNRLVVAYENLTIWSPELPDGEFLQP